jgi:hypothetical protein
MSITPFLQTPNPLASAKSMIASTPSAGSSSAFATPKPIVQAPAPNPIAQPMQQSGLINGVDQATYNRLDNLFKTPTTPTAPIVPPLTINPTNPATGGVPSTSLSGTTKADVLSTRNYLQELQDKIIQNTALSPAEMTARQNISDLNQQQLEAKQASEAEINRLMSSANLTREQAGGFLTEVNRRAQNNATQLALQQSAFSNVLGNAQASRESELNTFKTIYGMQQPVSVGGNLVNPTTGEVLYSAPRSPVSLSAGETLVDPITGQVVAGGSTNGLLSIAEATQLGVPYGTTREQALGMQPYKPPTEAQSKASGFALRMSDSDTVLKSNEQSIISQNPLLFQAKLYAEDSPVFNSMATDVVRQQRQAERNFLNALLRRESGAVISPTEFAEGAKQYFPRPADDAKTLEQKARNREVAKQALINEAGNAFTQTQNRLDSTTGGSNIVQTKAGAINVDW